MSESRQSKPTPPPSEGEQPRHVPFRETLRRPPVRSAMVFVIGLIADRVVTLLSPDSIQKLREFNAQLAAGAKAVQPWYGVALFWEKLTSNWPADMNLIGVPFFLLGRVFGAGLEAIFLPLSEGPATALPALVGYGLGLYIVWKVYDHRGKELNVVVGVVGTILVGSICLFVLQPIMIIATVIFGQVLGTVSTNLIVLASMIPMSPLLVKELIKHLLEERAQAVLDKALDGSKPQNEDRIKPPEAPAQEEILWHGDEKLIASPGVEEQAREDVEARRRAVGEARRRDEELGRKRMEAEELKRRASAEQERAEVKEPSPMTERGGGESVKGLAQRQGGKEQLFALKPAPQKVMNVFVAFGLISVFCGVVAIFNDSFIISIPLTVIGLLSLLYVAPKTSVRLRWEHLKDAKQTDFFRWFSLAEAGSAKDGSGHNIFTFRPEGEKFHDLVKLDVVLDYGHIAVLHLSLAKSLVDDDRDGIFARDITKSFIRSVIPKPDDGSVTDLANEIEYRHNFTLVTHASSERPHLPPQPTAGFLAFVGRQQLYEGTFSRSRLRIEQVNNSAGAAVVISIGAGR